MSKTNTNLRTALFLGAATAAALSLSTATFAQNVETVVVTGSLIQGNTNLVSPVTVIDTTTLDQRGISSIQGALQQTLANNGPALVNSFTSNGAFASGGSGVSLRGLTTNSTLVLFDGMRAAYYPLADDGTRNFVDLNTIPDDIVESIEVLRDGASSSYGADAIAGVVNIKTKKEFQGLSARVEGGIADRGDAAQYRFSVMAGVGDLSKDHVNAYISAFYYHDDPLRNSARPYPYNSVDATGICYQGTCGTNGAINGVQSDGTFSLSTAGNFMVRPYSLGPDGNITAVAGSRYQTENSNCGPGVTTVLTTAQQGATNPASVCTYDYAKVGGEIQPAESRFGLSGHTAFVLPNGAEGYVEANFLQDQVTYTGFYGEAATMVGNAPAPIYNKPFSTSNAYDPALPYAVGSEVLYLPEYVCPERTNCNATNGTLNPNNPFAGQVDANGNPIVARIIGRDWNTALPSGETRDRSYRVAGGINGSFYQDWKYNLGVTAMHTDLYSVNNGYVYIQHLLDVINDGTFNFINPSATPKSVMDYLMPTNTNNSSSDEAQVQASVTAPLFKLPGGDFTAVLGGSIAYEAVNSPSGNSDINGPTQRYMTLNAFGTKGSRDAYAYFFELNAPVIEEFVINASGRYDAYSTGPAHFSPKIGFWSKPIESVTLKGTYSEGFRIPSFGEANALPTTGYVTNSKSIFTDAYLQQYGAGCTIATYTTGCPTYITKGQYGETTLASPKLKPEKSRSWVLDVTYQPFDELTLTTTYYNIKKTGAITSFFSPAVTAYYAGQPIPAGYTIVPDAPDVNNPNAKPRISTIATNFVNATAVRTAGFDFSVTYDTDIDGFEQLVGVADALGSIHMTSTAQATFIQNLDTVFPDGHVERYDGTLGNFNLTAGTGTPKWKGTWQSTFTGGIYEFTSTLNWVAGYNLSAMDQGTGYRDCGMDGGNEACRTADYFTWDVNLQAHVRSDTTLYFTVLNVLDNLPPIDNVTYGAINYNPVTGGDGILGRYLKAGIKFDY